MTVRPACFADYEALTALFDELDEFHRRARPDFFQPFTGPARTREQLERWLVDPDSTVLVAENEAGVVGLALLLTRPQSAFPGAVPRKVIEIDNLVVRADQRGKGIGQRLLEAAVEWARQHRATHVEVAVHAFNGRARRFYRHFGFVPSLERLVVPASRSLAIARPMA
jgi:GNAT superfamily N-acetyltransferase